MSDLFGWFKRNAKNMKPYELKKQRKELQLSLELIDQEIERAANKTA